MEQKVFLSLRFGKHAPGSCAMFVRLFYACAHVTTPEQLNRCL
jgi:hypothetical protein